MTTESNRTEPRRPLAALAVLGASALLFAGCASAADTLDEASGAADTTVPAEETIDPAVDDSDASLGTAEQTDTEDQAESADEDATSTETKTSDTSSDTTESAPFDGVLTDVVADAQGGRSVFDGTVDEVADLEALVIDAWGDGGLGLHRGHAQVENVLQAFLGIDHDGMHDYMDQGRNLAATAEATGNNPDALVETLANSYIPFVMEGVDNGVITAEEADGWIDQIRVEFDDRVYWDGVSAS